MGVACWLTKATDAPLRMSNNYSFFKTALVSRTDFTFFAFLAYIKYFFSILVITTGRTTSQITRVSYVYFLYNYFPRIMLMQILMRTLQCSYQFLLPCLLGQSTMRALPQLSALTLLVTEDFFSHVFLLYIYIYMCVCVCVCVCTYRASGFKHQSFFFAFGRCPVRIASRLLCTVLQTNSGIVMTEILEFVYRPKMKNTKRFGAQICSLLQVESGKGENVQTGSLEKLVSVYGHKKKNSRRRTYFRNVIRHLQNITEEQLKFKYL